MMPRACKVLKIGWPGRKHHVEFASKETRDETLELNSVMTSLGMQIFSSRDHRKCRIPTRLNTADESGRYLSACHDLKRTL